MTNDQFEALVGRLEQQAQTNPRGYQFKVLMLALFGNAYLAAVLLVLVVVLLALVASVAVLKALALKLILIFGFFLWMVLKAMWVKIDPPTGVEIDARQAPELFAMVDALRRELGAPRFHHVLVTDEFNAGVVQTPRLGIFGWPRNYLLIGLPLMKSLSVEQFRAVLAHEFGHLARGHGRLSNWIYRQRLRWSRLLQALEANDSKGSFLFKPFIDRFAPYFNAYSFPLARANEYEADATSARLTSASAAAEALTGVNVVGSYLAERYWPQIHRQADDRPAPAFAPFVGMAQGVANEVDEDSARGWLEQALARRTDVADTHPALHDRLAAIGEAPRLAIPAAGDSADRLLGTALATITEGFDQRWLAHIQPSWTERYLEVSEGRRRLAELDALAAQGGELGLQDAYDRARLTESVGGAAEAAFEQYRELHRRAPDDSVINLTLGARLLGRDDAEGCALVERAMQLDDGAIASGSELLRDYHWRQGRSDEAHAWHQRLMERVQLEQAAARERDELKLSDKLDAHGLAPDEVAPLAAALAAIPGLRKAYLARKRVRHLADNPCFVLGYRVTPWYRLHSKRRAQEVMEQIRQSVRFPYETLIVNVEGDNYRFGRKLAWKRGTRVV